MGYRTDFLNQKWLHLLGDFVVGFFGVALAINLFLFGLTYPIDARLTGDAAEYMQIASRFESFYSAVSFVGERSSGMPVFDWIWRPSSMAGNPNFEDWMSIVCLALFCIHLLTSLVAIKTARDHTSIRSRWGLRFLFFVTGQPE